MMITFQTQEFQKRSTLLSKLHCKLLLCDMFSQETSEIQAVKLLAIPVYLIKKVFLGTFDYDLL